MQERKWALSLECRAMWKRGNDMLMNAFCMNRGVEWMCVWGKKKSVLMCTSVCLPFTWQVPSFSNDIKCHIMYSILHYITHVFIILQLYSHLNASVPPDFNSTVPIPPRFFFFFFHHWLVSTSRLLLQSYLIFLWFCFSAWFKISLAIIRTNMVGGKKRGSVSNGTTRWSGQVSEIKPVRSASR